MNSEATWLCCQIGAREHYAVPRALLGQDRLAGLLCDCWADGVWRRLGSLTGTAKRLAGRWHQELSTNRVHGFTARAIAFEVRCRAVGWQRIMERNEWFQDRVVKWLDRHGAKWESADSPPVVFAYSYAARRILAWAGSRGWHTVLGQIDPGPEEQAIVAELNRRHPEWADPSRRLAPMDYWEQWRIECETADRIMVNSDWSAELLARAAIPTEKIRVVPLAYEVGGRRAEGGSRRAEGGRRLRVLFLGQAILRKGIQDLVAAAHMLNREPVHFDVVGPYGKLPSDVPPNVTFHGPTERERVSQWYQAADVFVLPTHSDGFALTQLEAMAYGVPVIATPRCGDVVQPNVNGWVVAADAPRELAERLRILAEDPQQLDDMSEACRRRAEEFSVARLGDRLMHLW